MSILKKAKTIEKKVEQYRAARNAAEKIGTMEAVCPSCKATVEVQDIAFCEGCEKVICPECLKLDYEGAGLCSCCYDSLKEESC